MSFSPSSFALEMALASALGDNLMLLNSTNLVLCLLSAYGLFRLSTLGVGIAIYILPDLISTIANEPNLME